MKRRQRIQDGGSDNDSDDDSGEDEDAGGWENVQHRRRQIRKWEVVKPQPSAGPLLERVNRL